MKNLLKYIIPVVIVIGIVLFIKLGFNYEYKFTKITLIKYIELNQSKELSVIQIVDDTTQVSKTTSDIIKKVFQGRKRKIYLLDITNLTDEEKLEFINANSLTKETMSYSTPTLLVVQNGVTLDSKVGIFSEDELINFIIKNDIK